MTGRMWELWKPKPIIQIDTEMSLDSVFQHSKEKYSITPTDLHGTTKMLLKVVSRMTGHGEYTVPVLSSPPLEVGYQIPS